MTRPGRAGGAACAGRKHPKTRLKRRSPSPMLFTDELIADARRRYEETAEVLTSIAFDLGIHRSTFRELALRGGWVRYRPAPRGLSPASRLLDGARSLAAEAKRQAENAGGASAQPSQADAARPEAAPTSPGPAVTAPAGPQDIAASAAWLRREVQAQTAVVKQLREQERAEPLTEDRALLLARILVSLTEALIKLKRVEEGAPASLPGEPDDLPENIDDFRNELARRIRAFVASRTGIGHADGADAVPPVAGAGG